MVKSLDNMLQNVSVIGAAGKMGKGIAALLAVQMLNSKFRANDPKKEYRLNLVDLRYGDLNAALEYIEDEAIRWAEKHLNELKGFYKDRSNIVDNEDHITQFARDIRPLIVNSTDLDIMQDSHLVFEAIIEEPDLKIKKSKELKETCREDALYFTNTSSIPINVLDKGAALNGKIIGYHFYNPPPKQRLLELITNKGTDHDLIKIGKELAKRLEKTVVESNDIAGFIGNGHFMRECMYAAEEVERLKDKGMAEAEAIFRINDISRSYLQRPMGNIPVNGLCWNRCYTKDYEGNGYIWRRYNRL